jgi:hypothetical protein
MKNESNEHYSNHHSSIRSSTERCLMPKRAPKVRRDILGMLPWAGASGEPLKGWLGIRRGR